MRIAYVTDQPFPSRAANSIHVMKMCGAFAANGHHVTLIVPPFADEPELTDPFGHYGVEARFTLRRVSWYPRALGSYGYAGQAAAIGRAAGVHLVYGRCQHACLASCLLGLSAGYEAHRPISEASAEGRWAFRRLVRRRRFTRLVVISEALRDAFLDLGLPPERILLARDAANDPCAVKLLDFARSERLQVGYVGHLYPGKGLEVVLPLAAACPWADFHVVGGTEPDLARWRALAGGRPNLFFHGFVSPAETDRYRLSCHVLLAPYQPVVRSHWETDDIAPWMSPLKLFEYMAAAKPVLCSDLAVLREFLAPGRTALLCDPGAIDSWTSALIRMRDDPGLRMRLGSAARAVFLERHTWRGRARAVLEGAHPLLSGTARDST